MFRDIPFFFLLLCKENRNKKGENNKRKKSLPTLSASATASVSRLYGNDTSTHPFSSPLSFPSFHYSPSTLSDVSIVSDAPTGAL